MSVTIYHNPRCSKSRETLALLEEKGIQPTIELYLQQHYSVEALQQLADDDESSTYSKPLTNGPWFIPHDGIVLFLLAEVRDRVIFT